MTIKAGVLAAILLRAPDAEVRFWISKDEEAEFDVIYDDITDVALSNDEGAWVADGVDVVNIDVEPLNWEEEELRGTGGGYEDGYLPEYGEV